MASKNGESVKSWLLASPVVLAAVVSVFLTVGDITGSGDDTNTDDGVVIVDGQPSGNGQGNGNGNGGGNNVDTSLTAVQLYNLYIDSDNTSANIIYNGTNIAVTGIMVSFGEDTDTGSNYYGRYVTLQTNENGEDLIKCYFPDDTIIYLENLPSLVGTEVTVYGICDGMLDGIVYLVECHSPKISDAHAY